MKIQIPEALKQDAPQTTWGKILTATPIIMTVIATALAGLASSEMTRAQYARSLAAQQQSKAGDQWSFFQAKRLRGSMQHSTIDLMEATLELRPLDGAALAKVEPAPDTAAIAALQSATLPAPPPAPDMALQVKTALGMLEASKPDSEIADVLLKVDAKILAQTVNAERARAEAFDAATKPITQTIDRIERSLAAGDRTLARAITVARLRFAAARYDAEARLNQAVAQAIELQVRKSNLTAERHHRRSQRFFIGMLAAQAAVIVSTFSLAARRHSALWTVAAAAGLAAIAFAIYVYFYV